MDSLRQLSYSVQEALRTIALLRREKEDLKLEIERVFREKERELEALRQELETLRNHATQAIVPEPSALLSPQEVAALTVPAGQTADLSQPNQEAPVTDQEKLAWEKERKALKKEQKKLQVLKRERALVKRKLEEIYQELESIRLA